MKNSKCSLNVPYLLALVAIMALYILFCRPALEGFRRRNKPVRTNNRYVRKRMTTKTRYVPARVRYTTEDLEWFTENIRYIDIYPHVNKADSVKYDLAAQTASQLGVPDDEFGNKFALLVEAMKSPHLFKEEFGYKGFWWYPWYENKLNNHKNSETLFRDTDGLTRMLRAYLEDKDHNKQTDENEPFKFPGNPTFEGVSIYP